MREVGRLSKKRVGFYGGTFDPIHIGHLALAIELSERHHLDEVLFCPAGLAPNKEHTKPLASYAHRYRMVEEAISSFPNFALIDLEREEGEPSYTVDTLTLLHKLLPGTELFLLLADDTAMTWPSWKGPEQILSLAKPLIARRLREEAPFDRLPSPIGKAVAAGMTQTPLIEISSTQIRGRIKKKLPCHHLLPQKVLDYIMNHQLYS